MTYWRMQLHPNEAEVSVGHAVKSLAAAFIGLDFGPDVGDMARCTKDELPDGQKDYFDFCHVMKEGDKVLIVAHHFPFAVCEVAGPYNYIKDTDENLGVWFRHFRRVTNVRYYADLVTNAMDWQKCTMTDAISILNDKATISYKLIEDLTRLP